MWVYSLLGKLVVNDRCCVCVGYCARVVDSSFRGRELHGAELVIPDGYDALVLHKSGNRSSEWEAVHNMTSIVYFNHAKPPSINDAIPKCFSWLHLAKVLHNPVGAPLPDLPPATEAKRSAAKTGATAHSSTASTPSTASAPSTAAPASAAGEVEAAPNDEAQKAM